MSYHIAISGAGIGGLCAAFALARCGHQVTLFERRAQLDSTGAGIVLAQNAMANLYDLGLSAQVGEAGTSLSVMRLCTPSGRSLSVASSLVSYRGKPLSSVGIHRRALSQVLFDACESTERVLIQFGEAVQGMRIHSHGVEVQTNHRQQVFDLLIGADGIYSTVRSLLHGSEPVREAGYRCLRGVAEGSFDLGNTMQEAWGRGCRFGLVPITNRHVYWFAVENALPGQLIAESERKQYVLRKFSHFSQPAMAVVEATREAILMHDLGDRAPLQVWGRGPVTLLGDAAHPMTPNLGQGAGQSIEDAAFLAHELRQLPQNIEPMQALRAYERSRIQRANQFVVQSRRLGRVAQCENAVLCWLRDTALVLTPNRVGEGRLTRLLSAGVPQTKTLVGPGNELSLSS